MSENAGLWTKKMHMEALNMGERFTTRCPSLARWEDLLGREHLVLPRLRQSCLRFFGIELEHVL
jgi:hypothetical protein